MCRREEEQKRALENQLQEVKEREEEAAELEREELELIKEKIALEDAVSKETAQTIITYNRRKSEESLKENRNSKTLGKSASIQLVKQEMRLYFK